MCTVAATRAITAVIMKASIALTPSDQRTSQMTRPAVVARTRPMRAGRLPERAGELLDKRSYRGGRVAGPRGGALRALAHEAAADDHAVGARGRGRGRLLGRRDAEPERHWHAGRR